MTIVYPCICLMFSFSGSIQVVPINLFSITCLKLKYIETEYCTLSELLLYRIRIRHPATRSQSCS